MKGVKVGFDVVIQARVNRTTLATIMKFYLENGESWEIPKTRSEFVRTALEDFETFLVNSGNTKRIEGIEEASMIIERGVGQVSLNSGGRGMRSYQEKLKGEWEGGRKGSFGEIKSKQQVELEQKGYDVRGAIEIYEKLEAQEREIQTQAEIKRLRGEDGGGGVKELVETVDFDEMIRKENKKIEEMNKEMRDKVIHVKED